MAFLSAPQQEGSVHPLADCKSKLRCKQEGSTRFTARAKFDKKKSFGQ